MKTVLFFLTIVLLNSQEYEFEKESVYATIDKQIYRCKDKLKLSIINKNNFPIYYIINEEYKNDSVWIEGDFDIFRPYQSNIKPKLLQGNKSKMYKINIDYNNRNVNKNEFILRYRICLYKINRAKPYYTFVSDSFIVKCK